MIISLPWCASSHFPFSSRSYSLILILIYLFTGSNVSTTTEQRIPTTASTLLTTKTSNGSTPQLQTTAHQVATEAVSSPPGTQGMGETSPSSPSSRTQTTLITTPNATVFQEHTASPASGTPNVTTNTTLHTTSQGQNRFKPKIKTVFKKSVVMVELQFIIKTSLYQVDVQHHCTLGHS